MTMTSYLIGTPVPDAVDSETNDARPWDVAGAGVTNETKVIVTRVSARIVAQ